MPRKVWTQAGLIAAIRALHEAGVDLSPSGAQLSHPAMFASARSSNHFGSWRAAVEAAGLDYGAVKRPRPRWSRDSIVQRLRELHEGGHDFVDPHFKAQHRSLYMAACAQRYFGSWRAAIEAAGIDFNSLRETRVWTAARILRTIRELAARGEPLEWAYVEVQCPGIYRAARRPENFGSWRGALLAAGLSPAPERRGRKPRHAPARSRLGGNHFGGESAGVLDRPQVLPMPTVDAPARSGERI